MKQFVGWKVPKTKKAPGLFIHKKALEKVQPAQKVQPTLASRCKPVIQYSPPAWQAQ